MCAVPRTYYTVFELRAYQFISKTLRLLEIDIDNLQMRKYETWAA